MGPSETGANPRSQAVEPLIHEFLKRGQKSGNYQDLLKRVLLGSANSAQRSFLKHLAKEGVSSLEEIDKRVMADYANYLADRIEANQDRSSADDGISASTAWTYYDCVSAFFDFCIKWDYRPDNPAQKQAAKDELPERPSKNNPTEQYWSREDRQQLLSHVDRRVDKALDEKGFDAVEELRDRALVYLLAFSGVRGAEILSDPRDDRRDGLRWEDVHLAGDDNYITVFGKNQKEEQVQVPPQVHGPIERLERVLQPASGEWPVFPTRHAPTLAGGLPDGVSPGEDETYLDCYREHEVTPRSLSTNGGRNVMKRLCEATEIDVSDGYLQPHGARRGVGRLVYMEGGPAAAQKTLRHADPETTSEMYAHVEASELAEEVGDIFREEEIPDTYR